MVKLNLDLIVSDALEVTFNGKLYKIKDPGMAAMIGVIRKLQKIEDDPSNPNNLGFFSESVRSLTPSIPKKVFDQFSYDQLEALFELLTTHFLGKAEAKKKRAPASKAAKAKKKAKRKTAKKARRR
jgi:hypothetical protein